MLELTKRQQEILNFIILFKKQNSYAPTYREIMKEFGIKSPNGVNCTIRSLELKGYIKRIERSSRSIQILNEKTTLPEDLIQLLIDAREHIAAHYGSQAQILMQRIDKYLEGVSIDG